MHHIICSDQEGGRGGAPPTREELWRRRTPDRGPNYMSPSHRIKTILSSVIWKSMLVSMSLGAPDGRVWLPACLRPVGVSHGLRLPISYIYIYIYIYVRVAPCGARVFGIFYVDKGVLTCTRVHVLNNRCSDAGENTIS